LGLFKQELHDFSISREHVKWGIPVPFDASQVTYVWVDALANYITALGYGQADDINFKKFWPVDLHVLGKDILKFHCIFWPAMLIAADIEVPKNIFITGYLTIDGQKMSKTIGNIIDPNELVSQFGTDPTRYLLLCQFPFGADGDIKAENFVLQYNSDLANGIGNLVSRVTAMSEKYFAGVAPARDDELKEPVAAIWKIYQEGLENFQVDKAIEAIKKIVSLADGYIDKAKPWELAKTDQEKLAKVIYNLLEVIRHLGLLIYPIMPETAIKILTIVGKADFTNYHLANLNNWGLLNPGDKINKSEALFPRIQ
jgi:methionyl-tRNA synthetase